MVLKQTHSLGSCAAGRSIKESSKSQDWGSPTRRPEGEVSLGLCAPWLSRVVQCPQPPISFQLPALGPCEV